MQQNKIQTRWEFFFFQGQTTMDEKSQKRMEMVMKTVKSPSADEARVV